MFDKIKTKIKQFFASEKVKKILKGIFIASQYGLSIAAVSVCDYLMGLDWSSNSSIISVLIPLTINTTRQALKASK